MSNFELYQIALWVGRAYTAGLFFVGIILLARERLWVLQVVAMVAAASWIAYTILAGLGATPTATPLRLMSVWGDAVYIHVLLIVIDVLRKRRSLGALQPFSGSGSANV